jgi:hypothetical protein
VGPRILVGSRTVADGPAHAGLAVTKALQPVAVGQLDQHVRHCVAHADAGTINDMVTEATRAIERLLKT